MINYKTRLDTSDVYSTGIGSSNNPVTPWKRDKAVIDDDMRWQDNHLGVKSNLKCTLTLIKDLSVNWKTPFIKSSNTVEWTIFTYILL